MGKGLLIVVSLWLVLHGTCTAGQFDRLRDLIISTEPEIDPEADRLTLAVSLRNLVYWRVRMEATPPDHAPWTDVEQIWRDSVIDQKYGHECGGRAILFLIAARAFGIPARYVGLFARAEDIDPQTTFVHASSEVLIDGRWIVMDAHYNMTLADRAGRRLGWLEARSLLQNDKRVLITSGLAKVNPNITLSHYLKQYGISLRKATRYLNVAMHSDGKLVHPPLTVPTTWDGTLDYQDGSEFDTIQSITSGIYAELANEFKLDRTVVEALPPN